jgi:hypothetical protein
MQQSKTPNRRCAIYINSRRSALLEFLERDGFELSAPWQANRDQPQRPHPALHKVHDLICGSSQFLTPLATQHLAAPAGPDRPPRCHRRHS